MTYTMQTAAQAALDVQNAVNLSGVVHTFSKILSEVLWPVSSKMGAGTYWVNQHPITQLFVAKLADLSTLEISSPNILELEEQVREIAASEVPEIKMGVEHA